MSRYRTVPTLLTFLGVGEYKPVTYVWGNQEYVTRLFPTALTNWLNPSAVLVLLTAEAREHANWTQLQEELAGKVSLTPVDIPLGRSEAELWQIFGTLADCLNEGDAVAFDVTHAFRSIPLLSLLVATYLRVAKSVSLQHLFYGAFEARQPASTPPQPTDRAPVFDLSPFLTLLDWVTATDKFVKSGDGRELAELLQAAHRLPWTTAAPPDSADLPRFLQGLGRSLNTLSQALLLARPHDIAENATVLVQRLNDAGPEAARWARPFTVLLERTRTAYEPFTDNTLASQRDLVRWYIEHGYLFQGVALAREWVVSWTCARLGQDQIADREKAEEALNQASRRKRGESVSELSPLLAELEALPDRPLLLETWDSVNDLRNDIAHCGHRPQPRPTSRIIQAANGLLGKLDQLPWPDGPVPCSTTP